MRRRFAIAFAAAVALGLFLSGHVVRSHLGLDLSPASIQEAVAGMGWRAPALFLGLVTFRQFLFLPAIVLLPIGGVCFGAALGTALGSAGIVLSAWITFGLARGLGWRWRHALPARRYEKAIARLERAGPAIVAIATAHPTGPMSASFWGAGFSTMALLPFTLAVAVGGSLRAFAYSVFGSTLPAAGSPRFYVAAAALAAAAIVPLAHPGLRRRLLRLGEEPPPPAEPPTTVA